MIIIKTKLNVAALQSGAIKYIFYIAEESTAIINKTKLNAAASQSGVIKYISTSRDVIVML